MQCGSMANSLFVNMPAYIYQHSSYPAGARLKQSMCQIQENPVIERINDEDINHIFKMIVGHLEKLYIPCGGGDSLYIFKDAKGQVYKAFIRDVKGIDEPHIVIRKCSTGESSGKRGRRLCKD